MESVGTAAYLSSHSVTATVPGTKRKVKVIDPSSFGSSVSSHNLQATINAEASSSAQLSPIEFQQAQDAFAQMLVQAPVGATTEAAALVSPAGRPTVELATTHKVRITIYRWELEAIGWYYILVGGTATAAGAIFDFSGVGIPLGAILNVIGIGSGIGGSYIVWWADTYFGASRTYTISW